MILFGDLDMGFGGFLLALISAAVGAFASWLGSLFVYGFGQLIENSDIVASNVPQNGTTSGKVYSTPAAPMVSPAVVTNSWECTKCGTKNTGDYCKICSEKRHAAGGTHVPEQVADANSWKCPSCGRVNQNYVGTCGCGQLKP